MLKHYFKIAWRNLLRHKGISAINLFGFSIGLTFTFVIGAYIWNEWQVNRSLKAIDRQFIIQSQWKEAGMGPEVTTLAPLAEALSREYPQLLSSYYRWDGITASVSKGNAHFREELQIGDHGFLEMFGFQLKEGNAATVFKGPYSVVLTAEAATRYFGKAAALGQTLSIENFSGERRDFEVGGVMEAQPYNSVTGLTGEGQAQLYLSKEAIPFFGRAEMTDWNNAVTPAYITLKEGISAAEVGKAAAALIRKHADPYFSENLKPVVLPLKSYYLDSNKGVVRNMLYTLFFISQFILLMVLINFINISVSGSTGRIREIGVRKVLGGVKQQLAGQFLAESVFLVLLSVGFALLLYQGSRSFFSDILGKPLAGLGEFPAWFFGLLILAAIFTGLCAGLFPALVLSSFKTIDSLKGKLNSVSKNILLRKALVGFQFAVATVVLVGVFVISGQIALFFGKNLGYQKDLVLSVGTPRNWSPEGVARMKTLRDELKHLPQVSEATISYAIPDGRTGGSRQMARSGAELPVLMDMVEADANYAATYGMQMAAGSFLGNAADPQGIVINEAAAKAFGWSDPAQALGAELRPSPEEVYTVRGVIRDFHFASMKEAIRPLCFISLDAAPRYRFLSLKLSPGDLSKSIPALEAKWEALFPGAPFEYRFMDETLENLYRSEIRLEKASYTAAALAMIVVLLGIVGLVAISMQKRMKEIGIRKVLGSPVLSISGLFIKDFLLTGLVAGILICPPAYYFYQQWLNNYSYRISLSAWPFILAVALLLGVMVLLILVQTYRASVSKPVKSLRTE